MKYLIAIFLVSINLIPGHCQPKIDRDEIDQFSESRIIATAVEWGIGVNKDSTVVLGGSITFSDSLISINLSLMGSPIKNIGCFSEYNSKAKVKLTNGNVIDLSQLTKTTCPEFISNIGYIASSNENEILIEPKLIYSDQDESKNNLESYRWSAIRVYGTDGYMDFFPVEKPQVSGDMFFIQHLAIIQHRIKN